MPLSSYLYQLAHLLIESGGDRICLTRPNGHQNEDLAKLREITPLDMLNPRNKRKPHIPKKGSLFLLLFCFPKGNICF